MVVSSVLLEEFHLASIKYFLDQDPETFSECLDFRLFNLEEQRGGGENVHCNLLTTSENSSVSGNLALFKLS